MKFKLVRNPSKNGCTIGKLYIDGNFECYTLEDLVRTVKIAGITAIPTGQYSVIIDMSNRFKRLLPLLVNVPNFAGVRIHPGNTAADTEGCILVGTGVAADGGSIVNSRIAFNSLFDKMQAADKITLEIVNV